MAGRTKKEMEEIGLNTRFSSTNQPHGKQGRKPSLKRQLAKMAESKGVLTFPLKDAVIDEDAQVVKIKIPKEEAMALKVFQIAMGKNPQAALAAIKMYHEAFDGKPKMSMDVDMTATRIVGYGTGELDDSEEPEIE